MEHFSYYGASPDEQFQYNQQNFHPSSSRPVSRHAYPASYMQDAYQHMSVGVQEAYPHHTVGITEAYQHHGVPVQEGYGHHSVQGSKRVASFAQPLSFTNRDAERYYQQQAIQASHQATAQQPPSSSSPAAQTPVSTLTSSLMSEQLSKDQGQLIESIQERPTGAESTEVLQLRERAMMLERELAQRDREMVSARQHMREMDRERERTEKQLNQQQALIQQQQNQLLKLQQKQHQLINQQHYQPQSTLGADGENELDVDSVLSHNQSMTDQASSRQRLGLPATTQKLSIRACRELSKKRGRSGAPIPPKETVIYCDDGKSFCVTKVRDMGMELVPKNDLVPKRILVLAVHPHAPLEVLQNLQPGDFITSVNDVDASKLKNTDVVVEAILRGIPVGTMMQIGVITHDGRLVGNVKLDQDSHITPAHSRSHMAYQDDSYGPVNEEHEHSEAGQDVSPTQHRIMRDTSLWA